MKVMLTGATGFVGSHILKRLLERGHTAKCLVRSPEKALRLPDKSVEFVRGDITDADAVMNAASGVDAAIHLVGIVRQKGRAKYQDIHVRGTENVVNALKENKVQRLVHMSALGARAEAGSEYLTTKWRAEQVVRESGLKFTIFRPSIIFGPGDGFTARIIDLARIAPVVPIIGAGDTRYQPVSIHDVTACFVTALGDERTTGQTFELCGPETIEFEQYVDAVLSALGIHKPKIHLPVSILSPAVKLLERVLPNPPLTTDELAMAQEENTCSINAVTEYFYLTPIRLADVIIEVVASA